MWVIWAKLLFFIKMGLTRPLFGFYFRSFSQHKDKYSTNFTINDKSIDGALGSRTRGGMMEGVDESTELWRHPYKIIVATGFEKLPKVQSIAQSGHNVFGQLG